MKTEEMMKYHTKRMTLVLQQALFIIVLVILVVDLITPKLRAVLIIITAITSIWVMEKERKITIKQKKNRKKDCKTNRKTR